MIVINDIEQGSPEWHRLRLGVVTASRAAEFSAEPKLAPFPTKGVRYEKIGSEHRYDIMNDCLRGIFTGKNKKLLEDEIRSLLPRVYPDARQGYMCELVAQIATGLVPEEMSFKQCEWGKEHEDAARALFELKNDLDVIVPSFIYKDSDKRFGISPDGIVKGQKIGVEIKCPYTTKVFVEFATCNKIKQEYYDQCQFSMWVTGFDAWYFVNYDPRINGENLHQVLIERDQDYMDKYENAAKHFISDMDKMISKLNLNKISEL